MKYKVIDLFAGVGGMSLGFEMAGFDVVLANEYDKDIATAYKKNHSSTKMINEDITKLDLQSVFEQYKGNIDVIIGGPPCQGFSQKGKRKTIHDERNFLFKYYVKVVDLVKPQYFVMENVPNLLTAEKGYFKREIEELFSKMGYILDAGVLNAADYGVPQNRERLIILGIRKDLCEDVQVILHRFYLEILPKYKSKKKKTVAEAIGDLPKITPIINDEELKSRIGYSKPECHTTWHRARHHSLRDVEIYRMLANDIQSGRNEYVDSKSLSDLYEEKVGAKSPIHRYHVLRADEPSTTIISHLDRDGNRFIHYDPEQGRDITPREAARIQSFDDDFDFIGNQTDTYIMIGNAVPPLLAKCVGLAVSEVLDIL